MDFKYVITNGKLGYENISLPPPPTVSVTCKPEQEMEQQQSNTGSQLIAVIFAMVPVLFTLLFIHHKLLGNLTWSWWWVTAPAWLPVAIASIAAFWRAFVVAFRQSYNRTRKGGGRSKVGSDAL